MDYHRGLNIEVLMLLFQSLGISKVKKSIKTSGIGIEKFHLVL